MTDTSDYVRFLSRLPYTLKQEMNVFTGSPTDWSNPRNFDDDPHDPGGATQCGVIQVEYDVYRIERNEPKQSVRLITQVEGFDLYYTMYWLAYCPLLPVGLDLEFFDARVNEGTGEAIRILQFCLGITNDGQWGPHTLAAVKAITNPQAVITQFTARRAAVYRMMPGDKYYDADWQRRTQEIGEAALKLAEAA